jgi:large subunit ribosomal protein L25
METVLLNVEPRQSRGKEEAGRLRRQGKVPAVFYGPGNTTTAICVDAHEFGVKLAGLEGSHLIQLLSPPQPNVHEKMVLLKEVQRHPVSSALVHIDLYEIDVNKPIEVTVPLHFTGKAQGVTAGGILQPLRRDITVECLPREIPEFIQVDVSSLGLHDSIRITELTLPAGVKAIYETDDPVVTVASPMAAAEPVAAEAAAPVAETAAPAESAPAKAEKK